MIDERHNSKMDYEGNLIVDHGDSTTAWKAYDSYVRKIAAVDSPAAKAFSDKGIYFGQISYELAERASKIIRSSEQETFISTDFTPGFVTFDFPVEYVNDANRASIYPVIDARSAWVIGDVLDEIKQEVADCLGSPWKTLNTRAWGTRPKAEPMGPYGWHSDGFLSEIFKAIVYLTPLTQEYGVFEFKVGEQAVQHRSELPGSWALFKNTEIIHRGVPGTVYERLAIEITLCRSAAFDIRGRYPGQNSHWPSFPWIDTLEECSNIDAQYIADVALKCPQIFPASFRKHKDFTISGLVPLKMKEFYWTVTRAVGLGHLHDGSRN
jgi:hypothetical protein